MRHKKNINHLGRTSEHRKAMFSNMASSLILHKRITTTLAKAKALRSYIEPLITRAKEDSTHSRRMVFSYLQNKEAVSELFREISLKVADRPGGYTRILKTGPRLGDNAELCIIELVDYNELLLGQKEDQKGKSTRRRRGTTRKKGETEPRAGVKEKESAATSSDELEEEAAPEVAEESTPEVTEEITPEITGEVNEEMKAEEKPEENAGKKSTEGKE